MSAANSYGMKAGRDYMVEFHDTPQLWVAYFCGCSECPRGLGKTESEAVADLKERVEEGWLRKQPPTATNYADKT